MKEMSSVKQRRYGAFDGLRAIAAIIVILVHVQANGGFSVGGSLFVDMHHHFENIVVLFMIISGFSMCCGYYDKIINNKISMGQFYSKRYEKSWPFFALLCVIDVAISPSVNSLYEAFANMTLLHGLLNRPMSVIGVGWFLGIIFVFYLIFPFFCFLISDKRRAWLSMAAFIVLHIACVECFDIGSGNIIYNMPFFMAGGIAYIYRDWLREKSDKYGLVFLVLSLVCLIVDFLCMNSDLMSLVMYLLLLIYALGSKPKRLLENKVAKFISGVSLEIYLSHMVIYRVIEKLGIIHLFGTGIVSYIFIFAATFFGTVLFALAARRGLAVMATMLKKLSRTRKKTAIQG